MVHSEALAFGRGLFLVRGCYRGVGFCFTDGAAPGRGESSPCAPLFGCGACLGEDFAPVVSLRFDAEFEDGEFQDVFEVYATGGDVSLLQNPEVGSDPGSEMHMGVGEGGCLRRVPVKCHDLFRVRSFHSVIVSRRLDLPATPFRPNDAVYEYGRKTEFVISRETHRLAPVRRKRMFQSRRIADRAHRPHMSLQADT